MSKIDVKEVEAAMAAGDEEALESLTEESKERPRKPIGDPEDEPTRPWKKGKPRERKKPEPKLIPAEKNEEVPEMVKKETKQTKQIQPQYTPFGTALYNARQLTTRRPEEEQQDVLTALQNAMRQLSQDDQKKLVFRIRNEYLEGKCQASGLFAVAREARMRAVAVSAVAVRKTGLTFSGLQEAGIAKIVMGKDNKPYTSYSTGAENLAEAAKILRRQGNNNAAQILEAYLSRNERERALREATKEAANTSTDANDKTSKS